MLRTGLKPLFSKPGKILKRCHVRQILAHGDEGKPVLSGCFLALRADISLSDSGDHRATNALKNLLNVLANVVSIAIYIVHGIVAWPETMAMMAGALIGGFVGGRSMRFLPADLFRALVVGMGAILTVVFAGRYWTL